MKLVNKYQEGGVYMPPFYTFRSRPYTSTETGPTKSDKGSKSDEITDKDMLKMLEHLDGLPSDMALITQTLQDFYSGGMSRGSNIVGANAFSDRDTSNIAAGYINILSQMKVANFNKKEYDNAYAQVSKNGGINEFAITDRGQLVCSDGKGDFKLMTPEELKESKGYSPLTNSELLYYRAQDPSLANNNRLLSVVQNGIGIEVVTKMIQDALNGLGSSENSQEGYIGQRHGQLISGIEAFEQATKEADGNVNFDGTVHDLYKYKYLTKAQAEQANAAFAYIYQTLPTNAKTLLKIKSDMTDTGAMQLIQQVVASKISNTSHLDITMTSEPKKSADPSAPTQTENDYEIGPITAIQEGQGGIDQPMKIIKGSGIQMSLYGRMYNRLVDKNGKVVSGNMSLSKMLDETLLGQVVDVADIQFGDQTMSNGEEQLQNITYNNNGVMRAILPVKADGVTVDLQLLEKYEEAMKEVKALEQQKRQANANNPQATDEDNILTPKELQAIFSKYEGLDILLNNGHLDTRKVRPFLVTTGYATEKLTGIQDSDYVYHISEQTPEGEQIADLIQRSLATEDYAPEVDYKDKWLLFEGRYDDIYRAAVYMPLVENIGIGIMADRGKMKQNLSDTMEAMYQGALRTKIQGGIGSMSAADLNLK